MSNRVVLNLDEIPDGGSLRTDVEGHEVALFRRGERVFAIAANCPHRGGPLDQGDVCGEFTVTCPWHGWVFDLNSGKSPSHPGQVRCFTVSIEDGKVTIEA